MPMINALVQQIHDSPWVPDSVNTLWIGHPGLALRKEIFFTQRNLLKLPKALH